MPPQLFDDPTVQEPLAAARPHQRKGRFATPDPIGSGPPGESCTTCRFATKLDYHNKTYHKCFLLKKYWTHGGATDIKLKWVACRSWLPQDVESRVLALGEYAQQCVEGRGWFKEPLLVIAEYYEELGQDMGWLRHVATKFQPMPV